MSSGNRIIDLMEAWQMDDASDLIKRGCSFEVDENRVYVSIDHNGSSIKSCPVPNGGALALTFGKDNYRISEKVARKAAEMTGNKKHNSDKTLSLVATGGSIINNLTITNTSGDRAVSYRSSPKHLMSRPLLHAIMQPTERERLLWRLLRRSALRAYYYWRAVLVLVPVTLAIEVYRGHPPTIQGIFAALVVALGGFFFRFRDDCIDVKRRAQAMKKTLERLNDPTREPPSEREQAPNRQNPPVYQRFKDLDTTTEDPVESILANAMDADDDDLKVVILEGLQTNATDRFSCGALIKVLESFDFDEGRQVAVELCAPHLSDPEHITAIHKAFDFEGSAVAAIRAARKAIHDQAKGTKHNPAALSRLIKSAENVIAEEAGQEETEDGNEKVMRS